MLTRNEDLLTTPDKRVLTVAGLVITRQRPGTASGVIFITLEDETGVCNVVVWPKTYERFRRAVIAGRLLKVRGRLQREGIVTHLIAWRIEDISHMLDTLSEVEHPGARKGIDAACDRIDEAKRPVPSAPTAPAPPSNSKRHTTRARHPREQAKVLFPSRDFH